MAIPGLKSLPLQPSSHFSKTSVENASDLFLSENGFSVGTRVDIRHLGATPLGFEVSAQCEVIEVDRRRVVFRVEAHDGVEKIGEGTHERFIMDNLDLFLQKTREKF